MAIDLINTQTLSKTTYITSFYMYVLTGHVKSLQS